MNISFIQLKGVVRELAAIRLELHRIADCLQYDLADKGIVVDPVPTSPEVSSVDYVDEEIDWGRENIPNFDALLKNVKE